MSGSFNLCMGLGLWVQGFVSGSFKLCLVYGVRSLGAGIRVRQLQVVYGVRSLGAGIRVRQLQPGRVPREWPRGEGQGHGRSLQVGPVFLFIY